MNAVLNLILIVFICGMAYIWMLQGLFSAFLHFVIVLICGAITLAVWEPLVLGLLMDWAPMMAWGLGLLAPFAVLILLLRILMDKVVPKGVQFQPLMNSIGGGLFGLLSAVVTAGFTMTAIGMMPMGESIMGYQRYIVDAKGNVTDAERGLWIPVDSMAMGFFDTLSTGGFTPSTPMAVYRPDLARESQVNRLRYDLMQNIHASPENVKITSVKTFDAASIEEAEFAGIDQSVRELLDGIPGPSNDIFVLVETTWQLATPAVDSDQTLRLPPVQFRLATTDKDGKNAELHAPVAFVGKTKSIHQKPYFYVISDSILMPYIFNSQGDSTRWLFRITPEDNPMYLRARSLRLMLPAEITHNEHEALPELLARGESQPDDSEPSSSANDHQASTPTSTGDSDLIADSDGLVVQATSELPIKFNINATTGFQHVAVRERRGRTTNHITSTSGQLTVENQRNMRVGGDTAVTGIFVPTHFRPIRVEFSPQRSRTIASQLRDAAAQLSGVWLADSRGNSIAPFAWVWRKSNGSMVIYSNPQAPIRSAGELPIRSMDRSDNLYLYFSVQPNVVLEDLHIGQDIQIDIQYTVD